MGGDILTFVSPPGSSNREVHYSYLSLPLWHCETFVRFPQKKVKSLSCCVNEHKLTVGVCLLPCLTDVLVRLLYFLFCPHFTLLHLSSRNTDDPEVSLQLQCQLHRPPHLCVHALTTEDGAGTPEPPAGQPRGHRNQHRYVHGREFSGKNRHTHTQYTFI